MLVFSGNQLSKDLLILHSFAYTCGPLVGIKRVGEGRKSEGDVPLVGGKGGERGCTNACCQTTLVAGNVDGLLTLPQGSWLERVGISCER